MTDTHAEAHKLHSAKLPITLCPPGSKKPLGEGWLDAKRPGKAWQKKRWTLKEIDRAFKALGELNVGVLFGPKSGLIDIEGDSPDAPHTYAELFKGCPPPVTASFRSRRGLHRLFAWHPDLEKVGKSKVEFRGLEIRIGANGKGAHSAFPPSVTNGVVRDWLNPLDECPAAPLPDLVVQRIIELCTNGFCRKVGVGDGKAAVNRETEAIASVSLSLCKPQHVAVADAIRRTLPSTRGHRHRAIFNFVRYLKAIPSLADAELGALRPIFEQWHTAALPYIGTREIDESWADFANSWVNVKFPAGQEPIRMVYQQAVSKRPPRAADRYKTDSLRRLVSLCRELQRVSGNEPFYLACRTAGQLLGITHVLANKWLRLLVLDDVLEVVKPGTQRHATRYRYLGD